MSKKDKKKREADGIWVSDERRITEECRQVYPALYKLQKAVFGVTVVVWLITLLGPTLLKKLAAGYGSWGNTFETVTLVLAFVMLVLYIIANYFWQEKKNSARSMSGRRQDSSAPPQKKPEQIRNDEKNGSDLTRGGQIFLRMI